MTAVDEVRGVPELADVVGVTTIPEDVGGMIEVDVLVVGEDDIDTVVDDGVLAVVGDDDIDMVEPDVLAVGDDDIDMVDPDVLLAVGDDDTVDHGVLLAVGDDDIDIVDPDVLLAVDDDIIDMVDPDVPLVVGDDIIDMVDPDVLLVVLPDAGIVDVGVLIEEPEISTAAAISVVSEADGKIQRFSVSYINSSQLATKLRNKHIEL